MFKQKLRPNRQRIVSPGTNVPSTSSTFNICGPQSLGAPGDLEIDGAPTVNGVWSAGFPGGRHISLTSTDDLSYINVTVYGTDKDGNAIQESTTGPNATTNVMNLYFNTVTRVHLDNDTSGFNITVGYADSLIALNASSPTVYKFNPANNETVLISVYGASSGVASECSLKITSPATLTCTFANGTTPTDTRIYFAGGTEPTLTASGTDWLEFINDGTTASGDNVWYGFVAGQDLKA